MSQLVQYEHRSVILFQS